MKRLTAWTAVAISALAARAGWTPAPCPLTTPWGEQVTPANAWREYPRPQLVRADWTNLNGLWQYAVTTGTQETASAPARWDGEILVPYALESSLSGVGRLLAPNELLWYRRSLAVAKRPGERTILHFGGVDYRAQVFLNGVEVSDVPHAGGQAPFSYDITDFARDGANELLVSVWDPTTAYQGACGKQVFKPGFISYTRTSGIWQTVWTENVPETHVTGYVTSGVDLEKGTVRLTVSGVETTADRRAGVSGTVTVESEGRSVASVPFVFGETVTLALPTPVRAWSPETPNLYTLRFRYGRDAASGYCALRTFEKRKDANGVWRFFLNGRPYYFQGTLDQGWWPESLLTPPSEAAMAFDIGTLRGFGFNMMRKHVKVEPARYYWLCDTMGLMVLQDMPSGNGDRVKRYGEYRSEFKDVVDALRVFPSIVMWAPYNEGWGQPGAYLTACSTEWVRRYDPDRLVDGPSGWNEYGCDSADAIDLHRYRGPGMHPVHPARISFLGEFGGIGRNVTGHMWDVKQTSRWAEREAQEREGLRRDYRETMERLKAYVRCGLAGSVYTQTTDVEYELNGLMTYDRKVLKFDASALRQMHAEVAEEARLAATRPVVRRTVLPRHSAWQVERKEGALTATLACALDPLGDVRTVIAELVHRDETDVYLNDVRIYHTGGSSRDYEYHVIDRAAFVAAAKPGENRFRVEVTRKREEPSFDLALLFVK